MLAPPRYGDAYRPTATLDPAVPARWYEQLNTDPAARVAAALGVQVVQRDQETLVASAWDQAADLRAVVALGRLADAGIAVAERLQARHLSPLPAEVGVFVVAPLFPRMQLDPVIGAPELALTLGGDGVPVQALGATVRRVVRTRGATVRHAGRTVAEPSSFDVAARVGAIAGPMRPRIDAGRLATLDVLGAAATSPVDLAWALMRPEVFTDQLPRPVFSVRPLSLAGAGGGVSAPAA